MAEGRSIAARRGAKHVLALVHGWVGVVCSLFIFLIAATGVGLAFFGEMTEIQYGDMVRAPAAPDADIGAIIAAAEAGHPQLQTAGLFMPDTRIEGLETALVHGPSAAAETGYMMVSVDAGTATYKGAFELHHLFAHEFNDFHFSLLMGDVLQTIIAIVGVLLIVFVLTGLYLWWPRRGSAGRKLIDFRRRGRLLPVLFNWHGLAGIWIGILVLLYAVTGIGLSKPDWLGPATAQVDEPAAWDARFRTDCGDSVTASQAAAQALAAFPGHEITSFDIVRGDENKYMVSLRDAGDWNVRFGDAHAEVHAQCAGEMWTTTLAQQNAPAIFGTLMLSLHGGHIFGALQEVATVLTGLGLMLLSGSGVYIFFKRTLPAQASRKAMKRNRKMDVAHPAE
ncbi:MAG: PepSY-associated TM helix domain-containing protein [Pseudomonadota bacterium]